MAFARWYAGGIGKVLGKQIDWVNDSIKVALMKTSYSPSVNNHNKWADISANEVTGTGYTSGGVALASKTCTYSTSKFAWTLDAADTTFPNVSVTFRYAVIYDDSVTDKPLLGYIDFGSGQTATAEDLTLEWAYFYSDEDSGSITTDAGILRISV
ncbi:hypothetical protein [Streptomyces albogriseolus]|uniref:hypothetical protein n=1 Tax=Streptomyces albogriseolus TaxID=1887 RepID=UPI0036C23937